MNILVSLETDDHEVDLIFIVDNVDGENEWSIDYQYIVVSEDGAPGIVRTWDYLNKVYDPGKLAQLKQDAIDIAIDTYDKEDDHTLDDEGD